MAVVTNVSHNCSPSVQCDLLISEQGRLVDHRILSAGRVDSVSTPHRAALNEMVASWVVSRSQAGPKVSGKWDSLKIIFTTKESSMGLSFDTEVGVMK